MDDVQPDQLQTLAQRMKTGAWKFLRGVGGFVNAMAEAHEKRMAEPIPCPRCSAIHPRKVLQSARYRFPETLPRGFDRPYSACPACVQAAKQELERIRRSQRIAREYERVARQRERAREHGLPATLTGKQWIAKVERYQWKCAFCRRAAFTDLEHLTPISQGGGTTDDNCFPACKSCNSMKGKRHPDDFVWMGTAIDRIKAEQIAAHASLTLRSQSMMPRRRRRRPAHKRHQLSQLPRNQPSQDC